jgi:hypothetical protein
VAHHKAAGTSYFTHDASIKSGTIAAGVHASLDPSGLNKAGVNIRESRDSAEHPASRAVAVLFDVTGSMGAVPMAFKDALNKLMALLVKKGYLADPHVLFGAIGDATCDKVPLQIGQFEGGNEMDEALANIYLEGSGGGQQTESYELAMYYMARHIAMDCLEKRGQKGYLFLSGDEKPYGLDPDKDGTVGVKRAEVKRLIGDSLQADIPLAEILNDLREKFEVFWIYPKQGSYFNDATVMDPLRKLFGQNLLVLERADDICELIAATIGVAEGYDIHDIGSALKDIGADDGAIGRATAAVAVYAKSVTGLTKSAKVDGALVDVGADSVDRL